MHHRIIRCKRTLVANFSFNSILILTQQQIFEGTLILSWAEQAKLLLFEPYRRITPTLGSFSFTLLQLISEGTCRTDIHNNLHQTTLKVA